MFDRITFEPAVMGGRACIRGMRMTVSLVVNLVANGMSTEDIVREYPELGAEDIRQALQYASALANEEIGFFKSPAASAKRPSEGSDQWRNSKRAVRGSAMIWRLIR